jgi:hypothetical protein
VLEVRALLSFNPIQIRHAYGFDRVGFVDASHPLVAGDGTGQTIAIVDAFDDPNIASNLATFDSTYGLPAPPSFMKVNQRGGTTPPPPNRGWATEIALDVEYAHAMAPGANILLVEADSNSFANLNTAVQYAANNGAVAVSMSYGAGEFSGETSFDSIFTHPGVTYLSSTGDSGAPGGYQAFSPNVVAVGGTSLFLSGGNYSSESGWSGSGGGISQFEPQPSYQVGVVTQSNTRRTIPDLSFVADPNTGVIIYDTYGGSGFFTVGGTSASSPIMAGLTAIVDQGRSYLFGRSSYNGLDFLNAAYHLPQSDLKDIVTGNNGFPAGPGYDLVTGRGTPIVDRFVSGMIGAPVYNPLNGSLLVTGGGRGSSDAISLNQNISQLVVQVSAGTPVAGSGIPANQTFTFNTGQYNSVAVSTSDGTTTVNILNSTPTVPVTLIGEAGNNTLVAPDTPNTWSITGSNAGTLNGTIAFSGFQNLTGGSAADTFLFSNGAGVSGTINGGGGTNRLDYSAYTTGVTVNLSVGTATGTGGVLNIQQLRGGAGDDSLTGNASGTTTFFASPGNDTVTGVGGTNTLVGPNADSTWSVTATNAGTLTWDSSTTTFTGVQNLTGGSGADVFALSDGAGVTGTIDGGGGANTLDESAYSTAVTIDLSVTAATGVGGGFANLQRFAGGGVLSTLKGTNAATTWNVTGGDTGTLTGGFSFTGFGNLTGGSAADVFVFSDGASVDGTIDGGGGSNTLNYAAYTTGVTVNLQANVLNIQTLIGSAGGGNTLVGPNATTTWNITGSNTGTLTGGFSFSNFQNLTGGSSADTFVFSNGAGVDGTIDGGGGTNTLNYSAYTSTVIVNLQTSTATGVGGSIANIQNVTGGNGPGGYNILVGNGGNLLTGGNGRRNLLIAGASASTLIGGDGEDILIAGTTDYDTNAAALLGIMGVWTGPGAYADRGASLMDPGYQFSLNSGTVHSNGGGNTLTGKPGGSTALDLYFASLADTTDATGSDTVVSIF